MPNLPASIDREALNTALTGLGIDIEHLRSIAGDPKSITLTYLPTDPDGKKMVIDGAIAEITFHVPITSAG